MARASLIDWLFSNTKISGLRNLLFFAEYDNGNSGSSKTVDFANGAKQKITLNAATPAITISTPPGVGSFQLRIIQDGTGGREPTWTGLDAGRWGGAAAAPAINPNASGESILTVYYDGTTVTQTLMQIGVAYTFTAAPADAQYVTLATNATTTNERVLTAGKNLAIVDAGAGGAVTITPTFTPGRALARVRGYAQL